MCRYVVVVGGASAVSACSWIEPVYLVELIEHHDLLRHQAIDNVLRLGRDFSAKGSVRLRDIGGHLCAR